MRKCSVCNVKDEFLVLVYPRTRIPTILRQTLHHPKPVDHKNIRIPTARLGSQIDFHSCHTEPNANFIDAYGIYGVNTRNNEYYNIVDIAFFSFSHFLRRTHYWSDPRQKPINSDCLCRKLLLSAIMLSASSIHQTARAGPQGKLPAPFRIHSNNPNRFRTPQCKAIEIH